MSEPERIDLHDVRHGLKLEKDTGPTKLFANREGLECPACGDEFAELLASEERHNSFDPPKRVAFCVVREADRILVFTHD